MAPPPTPKPAGPLTNLSIEQVRRLADPGQLGPATARPVPTQVPPTSRPA